MTEQLMKAIQEKLKRVNSHIRDTVYYGSIATPDPQVGRITYCDVNEKYRELSYQEIVAWKSAMESVSRCSQEVYLEYRGMKDSWL